MNRDKNKEEETLLMKFLDSDLSPEEERKALHIIAEDEEMRSMLKFDRVLNSSLAGNQDLVSFEVPDDFTEQVMSRIEKIERSREFENNRHSVWDMLKQWTDILITPRELRYRPAVAYLFIIMLAVGFGYFTDFNPGVQNGDITSENTEFQLASGTDSEERVWIRFIYIDEDANDMAVAGDFSNWEPIALEKQVVDGKQLWSGLIPITKGEHKYMFVKDGEEWLTDPLAEVKRDDGFGNKNAVIVL